MTKRSKAKPVRFTPANILVSQRLARTALYIGTALGCSIAISAAPSTSHAGTPSTCTGLTTAAGGRFRHLHRREQPSIPNGIQFIDTTNALNVTVTGARAHIHSSAASASTSRAVRSLKYLYLTTRRGLVDHRHRRRHRRDRRLAAGHQQQPCCDHHRRRRDQRLLRNRRRHRVQRLGPDLARRHGAAAERRHLCCQQERQRHHHRQRERHRLCDREFRPTISAPSARARAATSTSATTKLYLGRQFGGQRHRGRGDRRRGRLSEEHRQHHHQSASPPASAGHHYNATGVASLSNATLQRHAQAIRVHQDHSSGPGPPRPRASYP